VFLCEGSAQIDAFLQRRDDAVLTATPPSPGQLLPLPDNDETTPPPRVSRAADGFYLALLEKLPRPG
jgi:16S rRNA (cytosine967-C5)-methyltransferase